MGKVGRRVARSHGAARFAWGGKHPAGMSATFVSNVAGQVGSRSALAS